MDDDAEDVTADMPVLEHRRRPAIDGVARPLPAETAPDGDGCGAARRVGRDEAGSHGVTPVITAKAGTQEHSSQCTSRASGPALELLGACYRGEDVIRRRAVIRRRPAPR